MRRAFIAVALAAQGIIVGCGTVLSVDGDDTPPPTRNDAAGSEGSAASEGGSATDAMAPDGDAAQPPVVLGGLTFALDKSAVEVIQRDTPGTFAVKIARPAGDTTPVTLSFTLPLDVMAVPSRIDASVRNEETFSLSSKGAFVAPQSIDAVVNIATKTGTGALSLRINLGRYFAATEPFQAIAAQSLRCSAWGAGGGGGNGGNGGGGGFAEGVITANAGAQVIVEIGGPGGASAAGANGGGPGGNEAPVGGGGGGFTSVRLGAVAALIAGGGGGGGTGGISTNGGAGCGQDGKGPAPGRGGSQTAGGASGGGNAGNGSMTSGGAGGMITTVGSGGGGGGGAYGGGGGDLSGGGGGSCLVPPGGMMVQGVYGVPALQGDPRRKGGAGNPGSAGLVLIVAM